MSIETISRVGGHIALDFMNTVGDHLADEPGDYLESYDDLIVWARVSGVITTDEADALRQQSIRQPINAENALAKAVGLREAVYCLLLDSIRHQPPDSADLNTLNQVLGEAPTRARLAHDGDHFVWQTSRTVTSLDHILWRLAWSAADLLASDQMARVKVCEGDECGWVFLDTSRNQARRWCSMADCGNRAKANRYYKRHKTESSPSVADRADSD